MNGRLGSFRSSKKGRNHAWRHKVKKKTATKARSKPTGKAKAEAKLKMAKVKLIAFQRQVKKEAAKAAVTLKRHQRAFKAAASRYKSALKTA